MAMTTMATSNIGIGGTITINHLPKAEPVKFCKCGTEPKVGDKFYYTSKYNKTGEPLEGYISEIRFDDVRTANGAYYKKIDIEIKTKKIKREEKLNKLGIK